MVDAFFLKLQGDNRKNVLAVDPAEGKTGEKGCIFHRTVEMKQPHTMAEPYKKQPRPMIGLSVNGLR